MFRKLSLIGMAFMLAACGGQDNGTAPAPSTAAVPEKAPAAAAATVNTEAKVTNGPNTLTLKPGHVFACDGRDRAVTSVSWSSTDPAVKGVTIQVQGGGDAERKVFTTGGIEGAAETGNWVVAGTRFFMVDSASGKDLVTHEVTALPCQ